MMNWYKQDGPSHGLKQGRGDTMTITGAATNEPDRAGALSQINSNRIGNFLNTLRHRRVSDADYRGLSRMLRGNISDVLGGLGGRFVPQARIDEPVAIAQPVGQPVPVIDAPAAPSFASTGSSYSLNGQQQPMASLNQMRPDLDLQNQWQTAGPLSGRALEDVIQSDRRYNNRTGVWNDEYGVQLQPEIQAPGDPEWMARTRRRGSHHPFLDDPDYRPNGFGSSLIPANWGF